MSINVFYIGPFNFPNGGAAARRILGNIYALKDNGVNVHVIDGKSTIGDNYQFGVNVTSVGERPKKEDNIFKKIYKYFTIGSGSIKYIDNLKLKPDAIILYSGYSPYLLRLLPYCKKHKIKLIFDCVEWYAPASMLGYLKPYYWNIEYAMRFLIPRCDAVICISTYLESYYFKKTIVSRIPPTLSVADMPSKSESFVYDIKKTIKLVYTGNPGHKDKLKEIVDIVKVLPSFELHIAGVHGENSSNIFFYGQLDYHDSIALVSNSHFSILLRPDNIISKAGFSTKVVESMSCGTPVITNNTGDLGSIINDSVNGFIFEGVKSEDLHAKLLKILQSDNFNYNNMSSKSKTTALRVFDYALYKDQILRLVN
ncbi:glycosyltransferase [Shewanella sp. 5S214]|uniref:glycosyltransferase n=1 Tax=Shewanella sp. 5S214 TaxID=3229999 RepID=UPI00352CA22A